MVLQAILAGLIALPWIGTALAGLLALFGVSVIGIAFPWVNNLILGGALFLGAMFVPDFTIFKGKKWHLGIKSILALSALMIIVAGFMGITPSVFGGNVFGTMGSIVRGEMTPCIAGQECTSDRMDAASATNVLIVVVLSFGVVFAMKKFGRK